MKNQLYNKSNLMKAAKLSRRGRRLNSFCISVQAYSPSYLSRIRQLG